MKALVAVGRTLAEATLAHELIGLVFGLEHRVRWGGAAVGSRLVF